MNQRSEVVHMAFMPHVHVRGAIIRSVVIGHATDVLQGLVGTCLGGGTLVMIGGVFRSQLQGPVDKHLQTDQIKETILLASKYIHNN